jgi:hypothetical protein
MTTSPKLDRVIELVKKCGIDIKSLYEKSQDEYVVITDGGIKGRDEVRRLYEMGLTVTKITTSEEATKGQEKGAVAICISQKEGAESIWFPPKHEERLWCDCAIYSNLEEDAEHCMKAYVPMIDKNIVGIVVKQLNYIKEKYKYTKFYQAVRYAGFFGKYDDNNCVALCLN